MIMVFPMITETPVLGAPRMEVVSDEGCTGAAAAGDRHRGATAVLLRDATPGMTPSRWGSRIWGPGRGPVLDSFRIALATDACTGDSWGQCQGWSAPAMGIAPETMPAQTGRIRAAAMRTRFHHPIRSFP